MVPSGRNANYHTLKSNLSHGDSGVIMKEFILSYKYKSIFGILVASLSIAAFARNEIIYPPKREVREAFLFLAQAKVGTRQYCDGNWNVGADKMQSVTLKCENSSSVSVSIRDLERNGWEAKDQKLAPHVTDYAPNVVPGYKRLTVVMQKVRVVPYFSDPYGDRYALPGEERTLEK